MGRTPSILVVVSTLVENTHVELYQILPFSVCSPTIYISSIFHSTMLITWVFQLHEEVYGIDLGN